MCSDNMVHWTVALLAMLHQLEFSSIVQYTDWLPAVCNVFYVDSELSESSFRNSLLVFRSGQRGETGTQKTHSKDQVQGVAEKMG